MSIRRKLTIMFLAIALLPLFFVSDLTYTNYKKSLEARRLSQLQDLTVFRADRIETYFSGIKSHIEIAQGFYNIKKNLPILIRFASDQNNPEFVAAKKMLDGQLQQMQSVSDLSDIMLVNPQGRVIYTSNNPRHYSKDMSNGNDAEQKAFSQGKDRIYFSDVYFDKTEDNRFEMLLTAPATDFNGAFIGVIAFEVDMTPLYKLIQDRTGLGETGEVLVARKIGNQVEYLNPLRHEPNTVMKRINIGEQIGGPIQEAVQGKTGAGQLIDYRGKNVISAWRYIPSLDWGLVAKIDTAEAFADVTNLKNLSIIIMVIIFVLAGIVAFSIARSISEPIKRLSEGAQIVGSGNLDYKIGTNLKDEIGQLSRTFDKMTQDLKTTTASRDELNIEIEERKQAEETLRQSEIKYRTVADNTYDWEFWIDPQSRFIYCSPSCERITGHKPQEFLSDPALRPSLIHPDDRAKVEKHIREIEHKEVEGVEEEWRYVRPDGTFCWVAHVCLPVYDDAGQFIGTRCSNRDITDRKKKEEELVRLNRTLRAISNSNQAMMHAKDESQFLKEVCDIIIKDCGHEMAWVSIAEDDENKTVRPAASAGFEEGYLQTLNITWSDTQRGRGPTGTAIRTGKISMCRNMQTDPAFEPWRNEAIKRGYASSIVFPLILGGRTFGALTIYSSEPDPFTKNEVELLTELAGDLSYGMATIRSRIERDRAQEAVKASEVRYRRLFEASRDGILILDSDSGQLVDVNPFIKEILGYSHEELLNKKLWEIGTFKNIVASKESFLELQNKEYVRFENMPLETKDGRRISVEFVSNVYLVDHKKVIQCNIRDITARVLAEEGLKRLAEELKRSNKDLEQFAYVASHDLQEPLRMIAGYTQLIQRRYKDKLDEDANQFIYYTVDGVVRMQSLINDLLAYSRLNTRSEDLKYVDCRDVLNEVLAALQMTIEESGAVIKLGPMPNIRADRTLLFQLFQNLIGNAIKFRSDTPPLINITAKPQDKQWLFSVSDNGIGMEPQYLERIFVIFQRLHTQDKYAGTGIGLAICKKIVERHGGRIWAESMPGKGSTFYFII